LCVLQVACFISDVYIVYAVADSLDAIVLLLVTLKTDRRVQFSSVTHSSDCGSMQNRSDLLQIMTKLLLDGPCVGPLQFLTVLNLLDSSGNYSATSNNMKLVHWPLIGDLLHLVQRGGAWAGCGPHPVPSSLYQINSPPINGQCTNHCIAI